MFVCGRRRHRQWGAEVAARRAAAQPARQQPLLRPTIARPAPHLVKGPQLCLSVRGAHRRVVRHLRAHTGAQPESSATHPRLPLCAGRSCPCTPCPPACRPAGLPLQLQPLLCNPAQPLQPKRTCSAMNFMPDSGRAYSKVSPRMGLNGFHGRSRPPKGLMVKPTTHASLAAGRRGRRACHSGGGLEQGLLRSGPPAPQTLAPRLKRCQCMGALFTRLTAHTGPHKPPRGPAPPCAPSARPCSVARATEGRRRDAQHAAERDGVRGSTAAPAQAAWRRRRHQHPPAAW